MIRLFFFVSLFHTLTYSCSNTLFPEQFVHFFGIQADTETDEVYAQMTLQPLNPVWFHFLTETRYLDYMATFNFLTFGYYNVFRKSKRKHIFLQSWERQINSQQTTFAKFWQPVIQALTEVSLFLAGQLKKFFLHW